VQRRRTDGLEEADRGVLGSLPESVRFFWKGEPMSKIELSATFLGIRMEPWDNGPGELPTIIGNAMAVGSTPSRFGVKGPADPSELIPECSYRFFGKWIDYKNRRSGRTEKQFQFTDYAREKPATREAIIAYLVDAGQGNGIGPGIAEQIYKLYDSKTIEAVRERPVEVADRISRLKAEKAEAVAAILKRQERVEKVTIDLTGLLSGRGFPKTLPRRVVAEWGTRAAEVISRYPYALQDFRGVGWKRCDDLWISLGLPANSPKRVAWCIWYECKSETSSGGHTWHEGIMNRVAKRIPSADASTREKGLRIALRAKLVRSVSIGSGLAIQAIDVDAERASLLADSTLAGKELRLAKRITLATEENTIWPKCEDDILSTHQIEELAKATRGPVGILGGSPGTGKTYTAAALIRAIGKQYGYNSLAVGAPTGKAAVRLSEVLDDYGIPVRAATWHSLLGVESSSESDGWSFRHNEFKPWKSKWIIGDESSMNDVGLMESIFSARARGAHVLLIGDVNQLPPVGPGAPLRDMIAAGLPYGELREIRRNSGGIVEACAAIRDGQEWEAGDNLILHEDREDQERINRLFHRLDAMESVGLDPVWQGQVLVARNKVGDCSRVELNRLLQRRFNSNPARKGTPFRLDDKVICLKNGDFRAIADETDLDNEDTQKNERGEVRVYNGEIGRIVRLEPKYFVAKVPSPGRTVIVPFGQVKESDEDAGSGSSWDLGYAITVHKSQGSSWPVVFTMLDDSRVCDRSWLYTAISRAEKQCELIGPKTLADKMVRKNSIGKRFTLLRQAILREQGIREVAEL
jgi:exodeoxyribonuclease V alpha subunit